MRKASAKFTRTWTPPLHCRNPALHSKVGIIGLRHQSPHLQRASLFHSPAHSTLQSTLQSSVHLVPPSPLVSAKGIRSRLQRPALACFLQVTRTIVTALPILWRWNFAKSHPKLMWALASIPLVGLLGLVGLAYEEHPFTERARLMFIDEPTELQMAADSYPTLVSRHRDQLLPSHHADYLAVGEIASELLKIVGPVREWKLHVIDDDRVVNAFVTPTGNIFVYTGLLRAAGNADAVAAILAHELAHVISRHGAEKLGFQHLARLCWDFVHSIVYTVTVNLPMLGDIAGRGLDFTKEMFTSLPYSRMCEKEADTIGMYLMSVAGYNPRAAVEFWAQMSRDGQAQADRPYEFLSDHPSHERRAEDLKLHLPAALEIYRSRQQIAAKVRDARRKDKTATSQALTMEDFNRGLFSVLQKHLAESLEREKPMPDMDVAQETLKLAQEKTSCFLHTRLAPQF
ncbi:peptidase family M48-domain-containing protein [Powellomyces hirtus]|nr:peptidase family M48-domain-containing protein [Powellomyces hirtus]